MRKYISSRWQMARQMQAAKGQGGFVGVSFVVGIFIVLLLGASLLPNAIDTWEAVDTSSWDGTVATIFSVILLMALIGVLLAIWRRAGSKGGM